MYTRSAIDGKMNRARSSSRRPTTSSRCRLIIVDGKFVTRRTVGTHARCRRRSTQLVAKARAERPKS